MQSLCLPTLKNIETPLSLYPLVYREGTSDLASFHQIFIQREYSCLDDLDDPKLVLDLGANVGYSAAYFLTRFPDCQVISVEPDPDNFAVLQRNLAPFGERSRVLQAAVWSHPVALKLSEAPFGDGREWSRHVRECQDDETAEFETVDVASLLEQSGHSVISVLKVDIEGAERIVFGSHFESWIGCVHNIVIELHGEECARVFFSALRGQPFQISSCGELAVCKRSPNGTVPTTNGEFPVAVRSASIEVSTRDMFQFYLDGDHNQLTVSFFKVLDYLSQTTYLELEGINRASLIQFVKVFLALFSQPDYVIPQEHVGRFLSMNELISNLVAMTPFGTTDGFLEVLRFQPSNLVKILTLYSARNRVRFDRRAFFDAHPQLASLWYSKFCSLYKTGLVREDVCQHMAEHLSYHDERMNLTTDMAEPYFGSTYVDGLIDRQVKPFLNEVVRRSIPLRCANTPNPRKIAVISDLWARTHSVYRTLYAYLASLKGHFHLTLFHCLRHEDIETSLFDEVHRLEFRDLSLDVTPLQSNDFMVAYFPDVGMTLPSIMLANCRIAHPGL